MTTRPEPAEYASSFSGYIQLVTEPDVFVVLENQPAELARIASRVPPDRERFRYSEGKWTIREVFGHLVDVERVMSYRAFCISRGEQNPLPGFDEGEYVQHSHYDNLPLTDLLLEFASVRKGTLAFLRRLDREAWERSGTANDHSVSVRALAYIMAGHVRHHCVILGERYGISAG
jgi:hypothetical protein